MSSYPPLCLFSEENSCNVDLKAVFQWCVFLRSYTFTYVCSIYASMNDFTCSEHYIILYYIILYYIIYFFHLEDPFLLTAYRESLWNQLIIQMIIDDHRHSSDDLSSFTQFIFFYRTFIILVLISRFLLLFHWRLHSITHASRRPRVVLENLSQIYIDPLANDRRQLVRYQVNDLNL